MPEIAIPMPHMGVSVTEGTVVAWRKQPGDEVKADEPVCDIATDKVDTEVVAPADGVFARVIAEVGETVAIGEPLAEMSVAEGTEVRSTEVRSDGPAAAGPAPSAAPTAHAPAEAAPRRFEPAAAAEAVVSRPGVRNGGLMSSPVARRVAHQHGVDLARIEGSGLRGRVRKADVLAAVESGGTAAPAQVTAPGDLPRGYDDVPHELITPSRQRKLIAEHMIRSRQTAAHMTTEAEVDMSAVARSRDELNARRAVTGQGKVSYLALIARATCAALGEFPNLNSTFELERHIRWQEINLGIAVDTEVGLLVPVIRQCERLTAPAIADAIGDLAERARTRKLTPDDMRAGTFTISNPGSVGAASAMAIINQPQVGILGTPAIVRRPVVVTDPTGQEAIAIRPMMMLALTFDHRAVDGAEATRCVVRIKQLLESWDTASYG
jgi:pyruvate dehydrogenase E2 component (dihydrolipoamide acetyltransferase)